MTAPAATARCRHCGVSVEGSDFCCPGCETAYEIVRGAGLERWYDERQAAPDRPRPVTADWRGLPTTERSDGAQEVQLCIDGLHCASCVWLVEKVLEQTDGVEEAHVSYASGRAKVAWDPARISLEQVGARIAALGYQPRPAGDQGDGDRDVLVRLGVAAFCTANIMGMTAALYAGWLDGMAERYAQLFRWASLALSAPVALWSAEPFYRGAWGALRHRLLHMDLPISVAILALFTHAIASTVLHLDSYVDSLGMLVTLLLAGRVVEARGRRAAGDAAAAIAAQLPSTARRLDGDQVATVAASDLRPGDRVVVGLGEEVPADGTVVEGQADLRMALLTGEAEPVQVQAGRPVIAGAPVVSGSVVVRVDAVGEDMLGHRMAAQVQSSVDRGLATTPADRIAPAFIGATLVTAGAALVGWTWSAGLAQGLQVMVAVLVVACPCALGLSYPVSVSAGLAALARRGLVLSSGDALLRLAEVDCIALDKTGTVTSGVPKVVSADDHVLRIAAALERGSSHPVARAILDEASRRGIPVGAATDVREHPGVGIDGQMGGVHWTLRRGGPGELILSGSDGLVGWIRLRDVHRDDAPRHLRALSQQGALTLLTGDQPEVAQRIADGVGIADVVARATPDDKARWIRRRREEGRKVLFVGDGLNDGPALAEAHVSLAMRGGSASSILVADGIISDDTLAPVVAALRTSEVVHQTVYDNMLRSLVYNVAAVTMAVAGLIDPLVAAILMPLSSAMVLWGASRVEKRVTMLEQQPHDR